MRCGERRGSACARCALQMSHPARSERAVCRAFDAVAAAWTGAGPAAGGARRVAGGGSGRIPAREAPRSRGCQHSAGPSGLAFCGMAEAAVVCGKTPEDVALPATGRGGQCECGRESRFAGRSWS